MPQISAAFQIKVWRLLEDSTYSKISLKNAGLNQGFTVL